MTQLFPADIDQIIDEKYDNADTVERYYYGWKRIIPVQGLQLSHICSWGNDPHPPETTPAELCVNTEPHHHHHDPNNVRRRKDSYIMTLDRAFFILLTTLRLAAYIIEMSVQQLLRGLF